MKALRESRNRTQEKVVAELNALTERLAAEGRVTKRPTFTVRQMSKWESEAGKRPYPHPETRAVLELYFQRSVEELGAPPRLRIHR